MWNKIRRVISGVSYLIIISELRLSLMKYNRTYQSSSHFAISCHCKFVESAKSFKTLVMCHLVHQSCNLVLLNDLPEYQHKYFNSFLPRWIYLWRHFSTLKIAFLGDSVYLRKSTECTHQSNCAKSLKINRKTKPDVLNTHSMSTWFSFWLRANQTFVNQNINVFVRHK